MAFKDHFSEHSASYARFRPRYPRALFDFAAGLCERRGTAWDCATGNGQAAVELARDFGRVIATDASAAQIGAALPHPRVTYRVATAEASGVTDASVDLVTVAQALHWFDLDGFYAEVRRVAAPGSAIVIWSYGDPGLEDPEADTILQRFNGGTLAAYWPADRHAVGAGYYGLPFPFREVPTPALTLRQRWTVEEFAGYLGTWSAVNAYRKRHGIDPVPDVQRALHERWTGTLDVRWPLAIRAGLVSE